MTREQVLKLFPDATDEQITNLLNQSNAELAKEKNKFTQYKEKADEAEELRKRLEELENNGLSDLDKATKELETANAKIAALEKAQALAEQRNSAVAKFNVTAEQAAQIVKDDGTFDYDVLGQIISEKETAAAKAKEAEIAAGSDNPGGGSGGKNDKKTDAEKIAEEIGKSLSEANSTADAVLKSYL